MTMTIGQRIKERRKELGLSQEELANRLGNKSRASVCTVERDKEDLTTTRIRQYAEALETTPAHLMGWDRVDNNNNDANDPETEFMKRATAYYQAYLDSAPEVQVAIDSLTKVTQKKS